MQRQFKLWIFAAMCTMGFASGQQPTPTKVKVVTVCELLSNVNRYAGTDVAVVGRVERSMSLIDQSRFLSQDHCQRPVKTNGHTWLTRIQIWDSPIAGMDKPPSSSPNIATAIIAAKLAAVRETTSLGTHQELGFQPSGKLVTATVPNKWAVVYGRIVKAFDLDTDCGAGGCGGDDVPLIILAEPREIRTLQR